MQTARASKRLLRGFGDIPAMVVKPM